MIVRGRKACNKEMMVEGLLWVVVVEVRVVIVVALVRVL